MNYPDIFLTDQDRLVVQVIRDFVEREIMPEILKDRRSHGDSYLEGRIDTERGDGG
jgi:hypothetical protein